MDRPDELNDPLDPPELAAELARMKQAETPNPELESRTIAELRSAGLIRSSRSGWRWLKVAAFFAASFLAGFWAGSAGGRAPETGDRYVLFLYGSGPAGSVEEHRRWAGDLRSQGLLVSGVKLKPEADPEAVSGYFVIRARSRQQADEIARSCPHARQGGAVDLRMVDPL
ncbi:MAG: YciI family protein [Bryobacteraceae bacterium]|nr:YciI family protein [Bryobacteraceae bacterium]